VVGLGNPGPRYEFTRHNVGFRVLDLLAGRLGLRFRRAAFRRLLTAHVKRAGHLIRLVKPLTYMNKSGEVIPQAGRGAALVVICDTLDLPPGACRLRRGGSSAGHKGLESVMRRLGSGDFLRLYVGIGRPGPGGQVVDHVLSAPAEPEASLIAGALERAAQAVLRLPEEGAERVMHALNQQPRG